MYKGRRHTLTRELQRCRQRRGLKYNEFDKWDIWEICANSKSWEEDGQLQIKNNFSLLDMDSVFWCLFAWSYFLVLFYENKCLENIDEGRGRGLKGCTRASQEVWVGKPDGLCTCSREQGSLGVAQRGAACKKPSDRGWSARSSSERGEVWMKLDGVVWKDECMRPSKRLSLAWPRARAKNNPRMPSARHGAW